LQYQKVAWLHDFDGEPSLTYSEIDDRRNEIRKIKIYKDDSFGLAKKDLEFGGAMLGLEPVPEIDEIKDDPQFVLQYIRQGEFETARFEYLNCLSEKIN
jgi:hypothetical protein